MIINAGGKHPEEWRLLQRIHIKFLGIDSRKDKYEVEEYGHFHADGDPDRSQIFDYKDQLDLSPILHLLEFASKRRLTSRGKIIGRSFQSLRPLSAKDTKLLEEYSSTLKPMKI